jgi:hypothetical protein
MNGKEKDRLSQEPLSTFYRFSLSLLAYITEYNYLAPGIMMVGNGPVWQAKGGAARTMQDRPTPLDNPRDRQAIQRAEAPFHQAGIPAGDPHGLDALG